MKGNKTKKTSICSLECYLYFNYAFVRAYQSGGMIFILRERYGMQDSKTFVSEILDLLMMFL